MSKKPRQSFRPMQVTRPRPQYQPARTLQTREVLKQDFRTCAAPAGCPNIIALWACPSGPAYCALHAHMGVKN